MNDVLDRVGRGRLIGIGIALAVVVLLRDEKEALVIGVITGLGYSLIALGLVLVYKSSGVFNFAQAEFGSVAVFVLYLARVNDVPYVFAAILSIAVALAMGWAVERGVVRPLFEAPRVTLLVATAGVALLSIGVTFWLNDAQGRVVDPAIEGNAFTLFDIIISKQRMLIVIVVAVISIVLALFFNRTTLGLAVLAASQEPTATNLVGISVRRLSSLVWVIAALLGALAGILTGPFEPFGPGAVTSKFLIPGFTAAVIGGMGSLPGAVLGGVIVGVGQSIGASGSLLPDSVPGGGAVVTFLLLAVILAIRPQGLMGKGK
ncbi:MAG TPA: branched-chain amino acid ABC transporter permease [Acidimicrobiales bacterium]|nr:branched-chain amino acid ABC transporter permease [Acidimicrobiales bacterium]